MDWAHQSKIRADRLDLFIFLNSDKCYLQETYFKHQDMQSESKRMEKDTLGKYEPKGSWLSCINSRKDSLSGKSVLGIEFPRLQPFLSHVYIQEKTVQPVMHTDSKVAPIIPASWYFFLWATSSPWVRAGPTCALNQENTAKMMGCHFCDYVT